jgi:hypothetical protein
MLDYARPLPSKPFDTSLYQFQHLSQLLALDSQVLSERRDWYGSAMSCLDQIAFSESLLHGSGVDGARVALSFQRPPRGGPLDDPIDPLTPANLRAVAQRLETITSRRVSFADILTDEKWLQLTIRDELLSDPNWERNLGGYTQSGLSSATQSRLGRMSQQARLLSIDKRSVMMDYSKYIDACIALARQGPGPLPSYPPAPADPVNSQLPSDFAYAHRLFANAASDDAQLLLKIALRCYWLDHAAYPPTLNALCPAYLKSLPVDPLAPTGRFAYRRTTHAYVLTAASASSLPPSAVITTMF